MWQLTLCNMKQELQREDWKKSTQTGERLAKRWCVSDALWEWDWDWKCARRWQRGWGCVWRWGGGQCVTRRLGWAGSLGCWIKQLKTTTAYGLNAADFWAYRLTNDTSDTADNNNDNNNGTRSICASIIATRWATIRATRGEQAERGRGSFGRVIYDNICSVNVAGRHVDRCLSQHRTSLGLAARCVRMDRCWLLI